MKKVLAGVLAVVIAMGCAVGVGAAEVPGVKKVTGIEAVWKGWDGDTQFHGWLDPYFNPECVDITVIYEDGTSEVLTEWADGDDNWWYWMHSDYDTQTGEVTFYYIDSYLSNAYRESLNDPNEHWNWRDLLPLASQTTIMVGFLLKDYSETLTKDELKLGKSKRITVAEGERKILAFTPKKSGYYYVYSENWGDTRPYAVLTDSALNVIDGNVNGLFGIYSTIVAEIKAGKTYYLFVSNDTSLYAGEFDIAVSGNIRKLNSLQGIVELLTGGFFRRYWFTYEFYHIDYLDVTIFSIPRKGTWKENAKDNWSSFNDWFEKRYGPPPVYDHGDG